MNCSQETPVILPALMARDFLQRASLDGYHKQPLTHMGGVGAPQVPSASDEKD